HLSVPKTQRKKCKLRRFAKELCGLDVSRSTVSRLCGLLHGRVAKWNERSLEGVAYPFLQADALVIRVRENRKVVKKVIQLAIGVSDAGYREVLGILVARQESEVRGAEPAGGGITSSHGGNLVDPDEAQTIQGTRFVHGRLNAMLPWVQRDPLF
ncbi:MAG TPA: hypothetical protein DCG87_02645, partial [Synergistaceae bacterium]|nr:hypothetical protein [Synergistaceae bacterium]